jgi:hypothetical protein
MDDSVLAADESLKGALDRLTLNKPSYLAYSAGDRAAQAYDYFQYPAMMVPTMLRDLTDIVISADHQIETVFDPFAGSGSVLTEAMFRGLGFVGMDVNPLAVLLCKVRSGPFRDQMLDERADYLLDAIDSDDSEIAEAAFPNIDKWFTHKAIRELSCIRRSIRLEPSLWCRRFFWVCLAETVRLCSNSRTSTFKLHIRSSKNLKERHSLSPILVFEQILTRNVEKCSEFAEILRASKVLRGARFSQPVTIRLSNCRTSRVKAQCDLLITSPPYGDNQTTVPYGQHSYLPLQWIDLADIDSSVDQTALASTHEIDSRSLGGSRRGAFNENDELSRLSPAFADILEQLASAPVDRRSRVAAFTRDLNGCINPILQRLRKNAYMIWVVGNRKVGGVEIPTRTMLADFLKANHAVHVVTASRGIPTKRMAPKNSVSETMSKEHILIFRKG